MAVTIRKPISYKWADEPVAFPVKTGETIYQGTFAGIGKDGYLYNLDSAACPEITIFGIVADDSANATGEAATTANGSISGTKEEGSAVAGDKTIRRVYIRGEFLLTFTSITQAMVGTTMYATDNYTIDDVSSGTACVPAGTLTTYISTTSGYLLLNDLGIGGGVRVAKVAVTGTAGNAGSLSWVNPTAKTCLVESFILDITTGSSGAATMDIGITTASASADTLIDGVKTSVASVKSNLVDGGTNGGVRKMTSGQYITATISGASATFVANGAIMYRIWS
jgi:hypothetical protein